MPRWSTRYRRFLETLKREHERALRVPPLPCLRGAGRRGPLGMSTTNRSASSDTRPRRVSGGSFAAGAASLRQEAVRRQLRLPGDEDLAVRDEGTVNFAATSSVSREPACAAVLELVERPVRRACRVEREEHAGIRPVPLDGPDNPVGRPVCRDRHRTRHGRGRSLEDRIVALVESRPFVSLKPCTLSPLGLKKT